MNAVVWIGLGMIIGSNTTTLSDPAPMAIAGAVLMAFGFFMAVIGEE